MQHFSHGPGSIKVPFPVPSFGPSHHLVMFATNFPVLSEIKFYLIIRAKFMFNHERRKQHRYGGQGL